MSSRMAERMLSTLLGCVEAGTITLGARLGCWRALAAAGERGLDADQLAAECGIHPRYAREWLEAMGVAGLLVVSGQRKHLRFALSDGVREVLVDAESEFYLLPLVRRMSAAMSSLRALESAYRDGSGVGLVEHDPDVRDSHGAVNQIPLRRHLPEWLSDYLPRVATRLSEGGRAADVGCGHGWACIGLAEAFTQARIDGFDIDGSNVQDARENAKLASVAERVTVHQSGIDSVPAGHYDLVLLAEMLRDVPDPVRVLSSARAALTAGGVVLVADMKVAGEHATPGDDIERLMYGFSLLVCLPDAMTSQSSAAKATAMRPTSLRQCAERAGLDVAIELLIEHDTWRFWVLRPAKAPSQRKLVASQLAGPGA